MSVEVSESKSITFAELRKTDQEVYAENKTPLPISIRDHNKDSSFDILLEPTGRDGSIQVLPRPALNLPGLRRMIMRGDVILSTDPNMEDRIDLQVASSLASEVARRSSLSESIDSNPADVDLVPSDCQECGNPSFQTRVQMSRGDIPLCDRHLHLSHLFVATTSVDLDGNEKITWSKTTVGPATLG